MVVVKKRTPEILRGSRIDALCDASRTALGADPARRANHFAFSECCPVLRKKINRLAITRNQSYLPRRPASTRGALRDRKARRRRGAVDGLWCETRGRRQEAECGGRGAAVA